MSGNKYYKDVLKKIVFVTLTLALLRLTNGIGGWFLLVLGIAYALMSNYAGLSFCYLMFSLTSIFNPTLSGMSLHLSLAARAGNIILPFFLLLGGATSCVNRDKLPLNWIFVYMGVAAISSVDGWFPFISYLKLTQFFSFIFGIVLVSRVMQRKEEGLYELRCFIMAIAVIMIAGSLIVKFIPTIGYSMMFNRMEKYGIDYNVHDFLLFDCPQLFYLIVAQSNACARYINLGYLGFVRYVAR